MQFKLHLLTSLLLVSTYFDIFCV